MQAKFVCTRCGCEADVDTRKPCCDCGGLWRLDYKLPDFDLNLINAHEWSIFRYKNFMALDGDAWRGVSLGEGMTPVIKLAPDLLLKQDYFMPTLSFKDRGAAVLISHCKAIGVDRVVQDSSGNAGNAVAAYCAKAGIKCEIFVPEGTSPKKIAMIKAHGAECNIISGNRDHCADVCRQKVFDEKIYYANHVYNPFFYEGTKTYIYEIYEQLGRLPENIFVPVGNGTLFLGVMYGLEHLLASKIINKMPQVIAIQGERCAPLSQAFNNHADEPADITPEPTLAEGIAIGKPMRGHEILALARKHGVKFINAPEAKILDARAELARRGVYCEHTTAANYVGYLEYKAKFGLTGESLLPMCGAGLKSDH